MTDQPSRPLRLLVVDDHEVVRQGLVALLDRRDGFQVVAEAGTAAESIEQARRFQPDIVVMDVRLPDGSGIEAMPRDPRRAARDPRRDAHLATPTRRPSCRRSSPAPRGYLLKQVRARDLVAALEAVGRGESLLDPAVTEKVLERVRRIATGTYTDEMAQPHRPGAEDPAARRRGQDEQGDRRGGLPVRQDGEELRSRRSCRSSTSSGGRRPRRSSRSTASTAAARSRAGRHAAQTARSTSMEDDLVAWGRVLRIETTGHRTGRPAQATVGYVERGPGRACRRGRVAGRGMGPEPAHRPGLPGHDRRRELGRRRDGRSRVRSTPPPSGTSSCATARRPSRSAPDRHSSCGARRADGRSPFAGRVPGLRARIDSRTCAS